ncbi:MAG: VWA domain-containing protein [Gammaproteobacteria bacterium]|nr:VWA domain-containing protein [Gammaproteobacteria bacterium]
MTTPKTVASMPIKQKTIALLLGLSLLSPVAAVEHPDHLLILLDLSRSMALPLDKITRIKAARQVFDEVIKKVPDNVVTGLRIFAHGGSKESSIACKETKLAVAFGKNNKGQISDLVNKQDPVGTKTPLAYALEQAKADLKGIPGNRKIILLSDGEENCDGNPEDIAQSLRDMNIVVDTIGIGDAGAASLGGIALAGGGKFYLGSNFQSLKEALAAAMGGSGRASAGGGTTTTPDNAGSGAAGSKTPTIKTTPGANGNLIKIIPLPPDNKDQTIYEAQAPAAPPKPTEPVLNLELILDASGSMAAKLGKLSKMQTAKKALAETVTALDSEFIRLAFRAYGFDTTIEKTKQKSCKNTELLVGFKNGKPDAIKAQAMKLSAYGYTPIAQSLRLAGLDLKPYKDQRPTIVLISDGEETCDGDPVAVIEELRKLGIDVRVHVIGFDLDDKARTQLQAVAKAGRGQYFDASNYRGLIDSLKKVVDDIWEQIAIAEPQRFTRPINGGDQLSSAVTLEPGRYTLKDNLAKGKKTYFFVPTKKGQRGVLRVQLQARALVKDRSGKIKEAKYAIDGMTIDIYRPDKKRIKGRSARVGGKLGKTAFTHFMDISGQGFYFTVGDNYNAVHRDALFELTIQEAGDVYNGQIAADRPQDTTLSIAVGESLYGHLGLEDRADSYHITRLPSGGGIEVEIKFPNPDYRFTVELYDGDKNRRRQKFTKLKGNASLSLKDLPAKAVIRVVDANPGLYHLFSSYALTITAK